MAGSGTIAKEDMGASCRTPRERETFRIRGIPPRRMRYLLDRWAAERPDKAHIALPDGSEWSFADIHARVRSKAAGLRALGVKQGDHVRACRLPNGPDVAFWPLA